MPQNKLNNAEKPLNPKLGFLGFLGVLGVMGIWTYQDTRDVFPFIFFSLFGFFCLFFERKMSAFPKDEQYKGKKREAKLQAYRLCAGIDMVAFVIITQGWLLQSNDAKLLFVTVIFSISVALFFILSKSFILRSYYRGRTKEK